MSAPEVQVGQLWQTPFGRYEVQILDVDEADGTCGVIEADTGRHSRGQCETLRELWHCVAHVEPSQVPGYQEVVMHGRLDAAQTRLLGLGPPLPGDDHPPW